MGKSQKCRASGNSSAENSSTPTGGSNTNATAGSSASCKDLMKVKRTRKRKSAPRESPLQRSSAYRGVTRHRWTGRYEAHLWDKDWCNAPEKKKGRQVYLGAYDDEEAAARAYDLATLKYWGRDTVLNFPVSTYLEDLKVMEGLSREEYVGSLRRKSSGFSRGVSKYRGVARHHHNGRWEARIGRVFGNKYLYLGTYATQEEAATAYDMAAIEHRGLNAVTNFDISRYSKYLRAPTSCGNPNSRHGSGNSDHGSGNSDHSPVQPMDAPPGNLHQEREGAGPGGGGDSTSALGLLLHSSELKQMLERASMAEGPPTPPESSEGRPPSRCSFPDDVQTYFECQDGGGCFADVDDFIFGGLDSIASSVVQWELDS